MIFTQAWPVFTMGEAYAQFPLGTVSIVDPLAALRELSEYCDYGESLNEMLRDRLVCGVNHEGIQKRLLAEKKLTYSKAFEISQAVEAAEQGTKDLKTAREPEHPVTSEGCHYTPAASKDSSAHGKDREQGDKKCYRCGSGEHLAPACKFKQTVCRFCSEKGHLACVCRAKQRSEGENDKDSKAHYLREEGWRRKNVRSFHRGDSEEQTHDS